MHRSFAFLYSHGYELKLKSALKYIGKLCLKKVFWILFDNYLMHYHHFDGFLALQLKGTNHEDLWIIQTKLIKDFSRSRKYIFTVCVLLHKCFILAPFYYTESQAEGSLIKLWHDLNIRPATPGTLHSFLFPLDAVFSLHYSLHLIYFSIFCRWISQHLASALLFVICWMYTFWRWKY